MCSPAATTETSSPDPNSPVIGAGHELLLRLGMPATRIQHRRVALKSAESDNVSPRLWLLWF